MITNFFTWLSHQNCCRFCCVNSLSSMTYSVSLSVILHVHRSPSLSPQLNHLTNTIIVRVLLSSGYYPAVSHTIIDVVCVVIVTNTPSCIMMHPLDGSALKPFDWRTDLHIQYLPVFYKSITSYARIYLIQQCHRRMSSWRSLVVNFSINFRRSGITIHK
jgi:hypothetical protein